MKLTSIKTALARILAQFDRVSTDKGLLASPDEEIVVGSSVSVVDEEGNESQAPDGEYKTEEGVVYVIKDGRVEEIREPEVIVDEEPAEETKEEVAAEEAPEAESEPEADPRDERIANLEAEVARLEEELGAARERIAELERENEELKNKPAAEPAEEEFERVNTQSKTGNKKLDNLINRFKA